MCLHFYHCRNLFSYHQKALATMPQLQLKASFGIATPELPQGLNFNVDDSWQEAMPGFDPSKVAKWMTQKDVRVVIIFSTLIPFFVHCFTTIESVSVHSTSTSHSFVYPSWTDAFTYSVFLFQYHSNQKEAEKLRSIPEVPIYHGDKDPNNASGCVLSWTGAAVLPGGLVSWITHTHTLSYPYLWLWLLPEPLFGRTHFFFFSIW